jgi:hypothetical protein
MRPRHSTISAASLDTLKEKLESCGDRLRPHRAIDIRNKTLDDYKRGVDNCGRAGRQLWRELISGSQDVHAGRRSISLEDRP